MEDLIQLNSFLYDRDFMDGAMTAELARKSLEKHSNIARLLQYNNHIGYVFDINALFKV